MRKRGFQDEKEKHIGFDNLCYDGCDHGLGEKERIRTLQRFRMGSTPKGYFLFFQRICVRDLNPRNIFAIIYFGTKCATQ